MGQRCVRRLVRRRGRPGRTEWRGTKRKGSLKMLRPAPGATGKRGADILGRGAKNSELASEPELLVYSLPGSLAEEVTWGLDFGEHIAV